MADRDLKHQELQHQLTLMRKQQEQFMAQVRSKYGFFTLGLTLSVLSLSTQANWLPDHGMLSFVFWSWTVGLILVLAATSYSAWYVFRAYHYLHFGDLTNRQMVNDKITKECSAGEAFYQNHLRHLQCIIGILLGGIVLLIASKAVSKF